MTGRTNPATGLQEQMEAFCDQYLIDFNATAAYARAGYRARGAAAAAAAARLLANPKVQAYLASRKAALVAKVEASQEDVLRAMVNLALGDVRSLFNADGSMKTMDQMSAAEAALIAGYEVLEEFEGAGKDRRFVGYTKKVKFVSKLDAVKTLGTHFGMFAKRHEHTGKDGGPIQNEHKVLGELLDLVDGEDTGIGKASSRR